MKSTNKFALLLAVSLGLAASSTYGTTFNYQYTFNDSLVVTGSLDGVQNGNFVDNVSNLSMFFNGTQVSGAIFGAAFTGSDWINGPILSVDALQNNFMFINSDFVNGDSTYDSYFYMLNSSVYLDQAFAHSGLLGFGDSQDNPPAAGAWSLQAVNGVPDSGMTAVMLGMALLGLACFRRKL